jgi:putative NADH-flavin reductase
MDIVVVGATGRTGQLVVQRALAEGHWVTAFTRRPELVPAGHDRLAVVRGDVTDPGAVRDVIAGKDAVISALGVSSRTTTTVFSEGITNVVRAMEDKGVRRVMAVSHAGLDTTVRMTLARKFFETYIVERIMRNVYLDLARMEDELEASDTDWTSVRPATLTSGPAGGEYRAAASGFHRPRRISRADLAGYLVSRLGDAGTYRRKVVVSY